MRQMNDQALSRAMLATLWTSLSLGCPARSMEPPIEASTDTDTGTGTGTAETGGRSETGSVAMQTGTDTGETGPPAECFEAQTEAQCDATDDAGARCAWFDVFAATQNGNACSFEPDGGFCASLEAGGTGCGLDATSCGLIVYRANDDGTTSLARVPEPASCGIDLSNTGFSECSVSDETGSGGMMDVCECACIEWPP